MAAAAPTLPTLAGVLGPDGLLARQLPGWEHRPQQLAMAELIGEAIRTSVHAVVEAPTGVGKSFGYLVPMILAGISEGRRVVISTASIALQEQLITKDLPAIERIIPELRPLLVKGRQNYLSRRRLAFAWEREAQGSILERESLEGIATWAQESVDGDIVGMDPQPASGLWSQVASDRGNCLGRSCPTYDTCFFYQARRRIEQANLLVVNHHLYFSDLALRDHHGAILPEHDLVVFDEAHALEDIATEHMGLTMTAGQVRHFLDGLHHPRREASLLSRPEFASAIPVIADARIANDAFWDRVEERITATGGDRLPLGGASLPAAPLREALLEVQRRINDLRELASDANTAQELKAQGDRASELAGMLAQLADRSLPGHVHYAEIPRIRGPGTRPNPSLRAHPLSVADSLRTLLFGPGGTTVLTSATLAADHSDRFLFLRSRLGIDGGLARRLDSPFDFSTQVRLLLNRSPLDPNSPRFEAAVARWLGEYLDTAEGGVFILFTSYRQLEAVHDLVLPRLEAARRFVFRQGASLSRTQMLKLFKQVGNGILFGTASFWEGVDVPGDALRHVIITRLPFEVPNHPLIEARHREIAARGGNPFMERTVPEAILRLKQGFGRLIRTRTDRGTVAILDHRVLTKAYGRYFLSALPPCAQERFDLDDTVDTGA